LSFLGGLFGGVASASGAQVAFASNLSPRVVVPLSSSDQSSAPAASGPLDFLLRMVKPSVRVETSLGDFVFEPYGPPAPAAGPIAFSVLAFGATVVAGLAVFGALQIARGKK
jgi:hypothetical protein